MELKERVDRLDDEVKVLKNEVQTVLLDIRESYLNRENPFNPDVSSPTLHSVVAAMSGPSTFAGDSGGNGNQHRGHDEDKYDSPEPENAIERDEPGTKKAPPRNTASPVKAAAPDEEEANEEVNEAPSSEEEPEMPQMQIQKNSTHGGNDNHNGKSDLEKIAGLVKWANEAVNIMGQPRTETVLDFAELTGHLPPELKNTLVKLINRVPAGIAGNGNGNNNNNGNGHSPAAHQLVLSLIELEGLLGMNNKSDEITLLAMVCQEVIK